jgi:hypothetical protein
MNVTLFQTPTQLTERKLLCTCLMQDRQLGMKLLLTRSLRSELK